MSLRINTTLILIDIIFLFAIFTEVNSVFWSCSENATAVPVVPGQVDGVWYEIAHMPSSDVPACLKVIAPESPSNDSYILKMDYVNNVSHGWQPTEEYLVFPWSEAEKGNFNLEYSGGAMKIIIRFKYLGSLMGYSVVCGYSNLVPSLSIIRILSRTKLVNSTIITTIDSLANQLNINLSQLTWVQQDGRCNGKGNMSSFGIGALLVVYLLEKIL